MGIQSSVNGLMQQLYTMGAISAGLRQQRKQSNEAQIQTEIAAGNAPMKDGKVDPEWLQKRRDEYEVRRINDFYNKMFDSDGKLSDVGKQEAQYYFNKLRKGIKFDKEVMDFYKDNRVQDYLNSFAKKNAKFRSALDELNSSISPELQNEVARVVAKDSVKSRVNNINKTKDEFKEHTESLLRKYQK